MQPQPAKEKGAKAIASTCQASSHSDQPCGAPATMRCKACGHSFCEDHAAAHRWHACLTHEDETGGEA